MWECRLLIANAFPLILDGEIIVKLIPKRFLMSYMYNFFVLQLTITSANLAVDLNNFSKDSQALVKCKDDVCQNGGTCMYDSRNPNNVFCSCMPAYAGQRCEHRNPCFDDVCANNGTCILNKDDLTDYICQCTEGYDGSNCDEPVDFECTEEVCNGARCQYNGNSFFCDCPYNKIGKYCEQLDYCVDQPCKHGGTCVINGSTYSCLCEKGWTGRNCTEDIDECKLSYPCGQGQCLNLNGSYQCTCERGRDPAKHCRDLLDECDQLKCENDGYCIFDVKTEKSKCECMPGFSGDVCNVRANGCTSCENGGTCIFIDGEFKCDCHSNYTGLRCEKTKSACELGQLKCQHGGQCYTNENGSARCHCPLKYTGRICEHRTTFCDLLLCKNGATCVEEKNGGGKCICKTGYTGENCEHTNPCYMLNPCEGLNSECVDTGNGEFTCRCMLGWTGYLCSVDINECVVNGSNPCGHGSCLNLPGHFECNCPKGLTGDRCEIDIDECSNDAQHNLCKNGGQCQNTFGGYECNCLKGFTGDHCQLLSMPECRDRAYCEQHQLNVTVDIPMKRGRKSNDHSARTQLLQYTSKLLNTDVYYLDKIDATGDQMPSKPCSKDRDGANYDCIQTTLSVTFPKCNPSTVLSEEICFNSTDQIIRFVSIQMNNTGHRYKTMIKENSDYIIRNVEAYVQGRPNNIQRRQQWLSDMMDNGDSQIAIVIIIIIISLLIIVAFVWFINIRGRKLIKINPDTVLRLIDEHHYGIKDGIQKYLNKFQESSSRKRKLSFDDKISDNKKLLSNNSSNSNSENSSVTQDPIFYDIPFKKYVKVYKESSNFAIYSSQDERNKSTTDQQLLSVSSPSNLIHLLTRENISPEQHIKAIEEQLISKDSKIPTYSSGETILHLAIRFNQIDVLKYFIDKYPEMLQVRDSYGRTVLHSACLRCPGNNELIYMLANRNDVDVDSFDNEGMTPLHHAISLNYNDVALLLMNTNAKIDLRQDGESGNTALHYAAQVNNINAIVCLIEKGATIDSLNLRRQTPMYLATVEGNNDAANILLSNGASPNITDSSGRDMLTVAMLKRNKPLVTMFRRVLIACQVSGQNKKDVIRTYENSKRKITKMPRQSTREIKSTSASNVTFVHDENNVDHLKLRQHINPTISMQSNGLFYQDDGSNEISCNDTPLCDIPISAPLASCCASNTFVNHSMMTSGPEYFDSCVHPDYKRIKFDNCIKSGIRTVHDKSSTLATNLVYHQMMPPDLRSTFQCQESYRRNPLMCYNQYIPGNAHHCHHHSKSINYSLLKDRSFALGAPGCCALQSHHHNHNCNSHTTVNHMSQFCVNTPCGHITETNIVQHNSPGVIDPYLFQVNCQANNENLQEILPSQNSYPGYDLY
ncbi:hypothetical protein GJ496_006083 [Pomphorhynchus laevis]|nr:hypothetical protein GJ496_006083 [Pomphorhynchus laevis]